MHACLLPSGSSLGCSPACLQTWAAIDARVQPVLAMVPALRRYVDAAKRWFNSPAQHQQ
jgi:hypothetical protein